MKKYGKDKILGYDFFEPHRRIAREHEIPSGFLVVEEEDYLRVLRFLDYSRSKAAEIIEHSEKTTKI